MSDTNSATEVFKSIVDKFDDLSKAYISPYTKYGPSAPAVSSTPPANTTPQNIANPAFDRGWNVMHEAPHGVYRTTGPMHAQPALAGNKQPIELLYAARQKGKMGPFSSVGFYGDKHLAEQARLEHHDRAAAGLLKTSKSNFEMNENMNKDESWHQDAEKQYGKHNFQDKMSSDTHPVHKGKYCKVCGMSQGYRLHNKDGKDSYQKSEYTAEELFDALRKSMVEKIKAGMALIQKAENEGAEKLNKGIGSLPSSTPSDKELHSNYLNKKAVLPHVGKEISPEGSGGQVTKGQKLGKTALPMQVPKAPALKPPGVPAAKPTDAPKAPTAPKAPGATNPVAKAQVMGEGAVGVNPLAMGEHQKMELPHSSTKASGGQMSKMDLPTNATIPTGIKVTGNAEGVQHGEAGSHGSSGDHQYQPGAMGSAPSPKNPTGLPTTSEAAIGGQTKGATVPAGPEVKGRPGATQTPEMGKMELPHTNQNANRGKVTSAKVPAGPQVKGRPGAVQKDEMSSEETPLTEESSAIEIHKGFSTGGVDLNKMALHPSPVFNVLRQGGAAGMKQAMMNDPKAGPAMQPAPVATPPPMPSPTAHAQRAQGFGDFMPQGKFGKNEQEVCGKCGKGMTLCKC